MLAGSRPMTDLVLSKHEQAATNRMPVDSTDEMVASGW